MRVKIIAATLGVLALVGLGVWGATTIWAQGGTPTPTPANTACSQYMTGLAGHLGVTVDKLTQAGKDTAKDMVDQAVKDGKLTADQATQAKQRIDQAQGCGFGGFGFRGFGGFGGFFGRGPKGPGAPGNGTPGTQPKVPYTGTLPYRGGVRPGRPFTQTNNIDGATLTEVVSDSPAAKAGLQVGDIILAVGGQNIDNQHLLNALIAQHKPGDVVDLKVQHGSDTKTVSVTLGAQPNNASVPYLGVRFTYRPRTT